MVLFFLQNYIDVIYNPLVTIRNKWLLFLIEKKILSFLSSESATFIKESILFKLYVIVRNTESFKWITSYETKYESFFINYVSYLGWLCLPPPLNKWQFCIRFWVDPKHKLKSCSTNYPIKWKWSFLILIYQWNSNHE